MTPTGNMAMLAFITKKENVSKKEKQSKRALLVLVDPVQRLGKVNGNAKLIIVLLSQNHKNR
jgi:hypothetical protein